MIKVDIRQCGNNVILCLQPENDKRYARIDPYDELLTLSRLTQLLNSSDIYAWNITQNDNVLLITLCFSWDRRAEEFITQAINMMQHNSNIYNVNEFLIFEVHEEDKLDGLIIMDENGVPCMEYRGNY